MSTNLRFATPSPDRSAFSVQVHRSCMWLDMALQWQPGSISKMWKFRSVGKIGWDLASQRTHPEPWGGQEPWGVPDMQRPAAHLSDAELAAELTYRLLSRS